MTDPTATFLTRFPGITNRDHHPALPLDRIDLPASMTNQSRTEPIDQPTVDRYVAALEDGATFPPIIVRRTRKQLVILGGNHRTRAHLNAGRTTIDAWIVDCDPTTALEISYADNATHGLPPTQAERVAHAVVLVDRGRTAADAARTVGIDPQAVHRRLAARGVEKRAADCKVAAELVDVPLTVHPRLASIRDNRVFTAVVKAVAKHGIGAGEAVRIIGDLNAQPDLKAALALLEVNVAEHLAGGGGPGRQVGRPSQNPRLMLLTALGTIRGLTPADVVDACRDDLDVETLRQACIAAGRHLMAIDKHARAAGRVAS